MMAINNSCQFREKQLLEKLCIRLRSAAGKIFKQLVQIMFDAASLCTADVIETSQLITFQCELLRNRRDTKK